MSITDIGVSALAADTQHTIALSFLADKFPNQDAVTVRSLKDFIRRSYPNDISSAGRTKKCRYVHKMTQSVQGIIMKRKACKNSTSIETDYENNNDSTPIETEDTNCDILRCDLITVIGISALRLRCDKVKI